MGAIASLITSLTLVYSTVYSDAGQRKYQSSASLAFVWEIHRGPVNSPHKWPVTRKMFPFDDVIMWVFHILVPCPSSSITLISLMPACIGSVRNYRNPIHCAYHSVISLLLSGSLWSHLWNKSRTKLDETSDKLAIFACNDSFQNKFKQVTTQSNNSLVMMDWCRLAPT